VSYFGNEPPAFNRGYLESRLAYRIQEIAYGGLKKETVKRIDILRDSVLRNAPLRKQEKEPPDHRHGVSKRISRGRTSSAGAG
jgi:hypothetical protein